MKGIEYTGINIQWPISELILNGKKTIETRTYPIPVDLIGKDVVLIETPGKKGKFKSRMRGIIKFERCFRYKSEEEFYQDIDQHYVEKGSSWAWKAEKEKWGWEVRVVEVFKEPLPLQKRTGIIFSKGINL